MNVLNLIAELIERENDLPVILKGEGEVIGIEYSDDGNLLLIGETENGKNNI